MPEYSKLSASGVSGCLLCHRHKMEKQLSFFEPLWINVYLIHGYVAIITKNRVHIRHNRVHLVVWWCRSCIRPSPSGDSSHICSPDGKVGDGLGTRLILRYLSVIIFACIRPRQARSPKNFTPNFWGIWWWLWILLALTLELIIYPGYGSNTCGFLWCHNIEYS